MDGAKWPGVVEQRLGIQGKGSRPRMYWALPGGGLAQPGVPAPSRDTLDPGGGYPPCNRDRSQKNPSLIARVSNVEELLMKEPFNCSVAPK